MILNPENYDLFDAIVTSAPGGLTASGQVKVEGPLAIPIPQAVSGEAIGATFIPADPGNANLPTWHVLIAKPIG